MSHTYRAIMNFRELGEKLWQAPGVGGPLNFALNSALKEMDYTVLFLLVNKHHDEQGVWFNRLKVLFRRLDTALLLRRSPILSAVAVAN